LLRVLCLLYEARPDPGSLDSAKQWPLKRPPLSRHRAVLVWRVCYSFLSIISIAVNLAVQTEKGKTFAGAEM